MGLKVSTTCELTFGADHPAVGTLIGGVHDGIRQMFMVIEHARMMVGAKAIETLSTAYLNALDFARNRVQGADLTRQADKTAPRVTIINHPDVRRMLMLQKSYAEGLRALVLYTATLQDAVQARPRHRGRTPTVRPPRRATTCCCRSSRASAPSGPTRCSRCRCRPWAAPGSCRTTRWSSTSGTRRSTPSTRARRPSSPWTSSSARSSVTPARASPACSPRSGSSPRRTPTAR